MRRVMLATLFSSLTLIAAAPPITRSIRIAARSIQCAILLAVTALLPLAHAQVSTAASHVVSEADRLLDPAFIKKPQQAVDRPLGVDRLGKHVCVIGQYPDAHRIP